MPLKRRKVYYLKLFAIPYLKFAYGAKDQKKKKSIHIILISFSFTPNYSINNCLPQPLPISSFSPPLFPLIIEEAGEALLLLFKLGLCAIWPLFIVDNFSLPPLFLLSCFWRWEIMSSLLASFRARSMNEGNEDWEMWFSSFFCIENEMRNICSIHMNFIYK